MEEPAGLLSTGSQRVRHDWSTLACMHASEKEMATHTTVLAWRIAGTEEPGGLPSMGSHRVGHDWSDLAAAAAAASQFHGLPDRAAHQVPLSMGFPRQEYWRRFPLPSLGDLSQSRDWTHVPFISRIGRQILYQSATWEALYYRWLKITQMHYFTVLIKSSKTKVSAGCDPTVLLGRINFLAFSSF